MIECVEVCRKLNTSCPIKDCRYWIDYDEELNCVFETTRKNDSLTLREAAERLKISYVRVKQLQDQALIKIKTTLNKNGHF